MCGQELCIGHVMFRGLSFRHPRGDVEYGAECTKPGSGERSLQGRRMGELRQAASRVLPSSVPAPCSPLCLCFRAAV